MTDIVYPVVMFGTSKTIWLAHDADTPVRVPVQIVADGLSFLGDGPAIENAGWRSTCHVQAVTGPYDALECVWEPFYMPAPEFERICAPDCAAAWGFPKSDQGTNPVLSHASA